MEWGVPARNGSGYPTKPLQIVTVFLYNKSNKTVANVKV